MQSLYLNLLLERLWSAAGCVCVSICPSLTEKSLFSLPLLPFILCLINLHCLYKPRKGLHTFLSLLSSSFPQSLVSILNSSQLRSCSSSHLSRGFFFFFFWNSCSIRISTWTLFFSNESSFFSLNLWLLLQCFIQALNDCLHTLLLCYWMNC